MGSLSSRDSQQNKRRSTTASKSTSSMARSAPTICSGGFPIGFGPCCRKCFPSICPIPTKKVTPRWAWSKSQGKACPLASPHGAVSGIDLVGLNCAVCHTSTIRSSADEEPQIVLGMPANTVDLKLFSLSFCSGNGWTIHSDNVLAHIEEKTDLNFIDRFLYRQAVYAFREGCTSPTTTTG